VPREKCARDLPVLWGVAGGLVGRMAGWHVLLRDRNSGPPWWVFWVRGWRTGGSSTPWRPQHGRSRCAASLKVKNRPVSGGDRRREVVDATLEALRHTVGRNEHMPFLKRLVEGQIGSVTFAEIADGLASIDVSKGDPE
jgi:hypothetical protein